MEIAMLPPIDGFSHIVDGKQVCLHIIRSSDKSCSCAITNYGARVVSLNVPDRQGNLQDVALGYTSLEGYLEQPEDYMGAVIGRCANTIAAGLFVLEGNTYALPINNNHNTLHGGIKGLHARVWEVVAVNENKLSLSYHSEDGEEGFPGNVDIRVSYDWVDDQTLQITYQAQTDRATLINLSNHTYFNLNGTGSDTILDHQLQIAADEITAVDETLIPTGKMSPVVDTAFDFTSFRIIGDMINSTGRSLGAEPGYNHNFVLREGDPALVLRSPVTGIVLSISTDRPGMQVYSGDALKGSIAGKGGTAYRSQSGIALEPQSFPDAIHHPQFPSVVLKPGEEYHSESKYHFSSSEW